MGEWEWNEERFTKEHWDAFGDNGYIHYFDCVNDFMGIRYVNMSISWYLVLNILAMTQLHEFFSSFAEI